MTSRSRSGLSISAWPLLVMFAGAVLTTPVLAEDSPPPENLRASVYSPGVFEIFWDREPQPLTYEIHESGGALLSTTDGTSAFFDHEPVFEGPYALIDVVAIDADGNRSVATSLMVQTGIEDDDADDEPGYVEPDGIFGIDGGISVLAQLNELVVGNPVNTEVLTRLHQITAWGRPVAELWDKGFVLVPVDSDGFDGLSSSRTRIECPEGGSYLQSLSESSSARTSVYEYEMDACAYDGVTHTGRVLSYPGEDFVYPDFSGTFSNYTITYDDGRSISVDTAWPGASGGWVRNLQSDMRDNLSTKAGHVLHGRYTVTDASGDTTIVENALQEWNNNKGGSNCVQLSMRVTAPWTDYQALQVDTFDDDWNKAALCDAPDGSPYLSDGYISVSDGLGRSLTLEPDGEQGYSLMSADGTGSSTRLYNIPWTEGVCVLFDESATANCTDAPPLY